VRCRHGEAIKLIEALGAAAHLAAEEYERRAHVIRVLQARKEREQKRKGGAE
jgi:hypothetical protein